MTIMIKKLIAFSALALVSNFLSAQVAEPLYYYYPHGYEPYKGGDKEFYKDFHQILLDKNMEPCENKNELYLMKVIVTEEGSVKYLKDEMNSGMAENNKCAYNLGLQVVKYMNKWKPLEVDSAKKQGVASYHIFPDALFENYKEGYTVESEPALLEGLPDGINKFRSEVVKKIHLDGFQWKQSFKLVALFTVNTEGVIEDITLENSSGVPEFDKRIISGIKNVKKKWSPAKIHGVPVRYRFRLPMSFGNPS
ncbi:energy transducer TonB [Chryseobacterium sp. 09-1422]|uniref:Energy transducer TonB n=1 Tax=Chryseobacterium kimseyorum TaxID=2984028 RepID=A0ABT3I011_9FLAO|nr:energy transducer TonB [Chryseobacterium kimseyorum]MCW3169377.1 energy transducer TonB [Chryseobacterium kimseyorum]